MNSIEFSLLDRTTPNSVISTTSNDLSNWSRLSSLWPLLYGTSCCFIEFASLIGSRFDFDRYGLVPRSSPRQADLILTAGTVTMKMAPSLVRLYEQMPEPKIRISINMKASFFQSIRLSGCRWWYLYRWILYISYNEVPHEWIYRIQICRITHVLIFYILGLPVPSSGLCSSCSIQTEWLYEITSILPHIMGNVGDVSIFPPGNL